MKLMMAIIMTMMLVMIVVMAWHDSGDHGGMDKVMGRGIGYDLGYRMDKVKDLVIGYGLGLKNGKGYWYRWLLRLGLVVKVLG